MKKVLLVNKTVGANYRILPVSGRSLKLYGNAILNASYGCPVFEMTPEEYDAAKFDVIANQTPGQSWVPVFIECSPLVNSEAAKVEPAEVLDGLIDMPINDLRRFAKLSGAKVISTAARTEIIRGIREAQKGDSV